MRTLLIVLTLALSLIGLSAPGPASATTVLKLSLQDLSTTAEAIVVGQCRSTQSVWDAERASVYTYTTFTVEEVVKGQNVGGEITVRLPGGAARGRRTTVSGVPSFKAGEEVVLFLTPPDPTGHPWVVGLAQGRFAVQTDPASGGKVVVGSPAGLELYDRAAGKVVPETGETRMPLDVFLRQVREAVGRRQ